MQKAIRFQFCAASYVTKISRCSQARVFSHIVVTFLAIFTTKSFSVRSVAPRFSRRLDLSLFNLSMAEDFVVPGNKSVYHARKFLNQARQKLRKENYFEALESFNKSLCFAEADSDEFSAALESRLKVIHEIREKQAASEFAPRAAREDADLENFFELSYPPHKNLPFVANCLELKSDENFGRFITATHDLIPGDILAIEEPFFKIVDRAAFHLRCANCLKSNHMILLPSNLTSSGECLRRF